MTKLAGFFVKVAALFLVLKDYLVKPGGLLSKLDPWESMSKSRKIVVVALVIKALTLFMVVQDGDSSSYLSIHADWSSTLYTHFGIPRQTGLQASPLSPFVLAYLFVMFATHRYFGPWFSKHRYKIAIPLLFIFTNASAALRTFGGFLTMTAFFMVCYAAWKSRSEPESQPGFVPDTPDSDT